MKIHTVHPTTPSGLRRAYQPYRKKPHVARWYENVRMRNRFFASAAAIAPEADPRLAST